MILKQYQKAFVDTPAIVVNFRPITLKQSAILQKRL